MSCYWSLSIKSGYITVKLSILCYTSCNLTKDAFFWANKFAVPINFMSSTIDSKQYNIIQEILLYAPVLARLFRRKIRAIVIARSSM